MAKHTKSINNNTFSTGKSIKIETINVKFHAILFPLSSETITPYSHIQKV